MVHPLVASVAVELRQVFTAASARALQLKPYIGVPFRLSLLETLACVGAAALFLACARAVLLALHAFASLVYGALCPRSLKSYGRWVAVSGASDGIGKATALAAAARGACAAQPPSRAAAAARRR
jgi:hypothetical protein